MGGCPSALQQEEVRKAKNFPCNRILFWYTILLKKFTMLIIDDKEDVNGEFLSQFESNEVPVFTHAEVLIGSQVYQVILRGKAALYLSL